MHKSPSKALQECLVGFSAHGREFSGPAYVTYQRDQDSCSGCDILLKLTWLPLHWTSHLPHSWYHFLNTVFHCTGLSCIFLDIWLYWSLLRKAYNTHASPFLSKCVTFPKYTRCSLQLFVPLPRTFPTPLPQVKSSSLKTQLKCPMSDIMGSSPSFSPILPWGHPWLWCLLTQQGSIPLHELFGGLITFFRRKNYNEFSYKPSGFNSLFMK